MTTHKTSRTIVALIVGLLVGTLFSPALVARADGEQPTGDLYAFAVQPTGCTPGYIHINAAEGATWTIDGLAVTVNAPSSEFPFPGGIQADVYATPTEGYAISGDVQGTEARPFYLQVNPLPASCNDDTSCEPVVHTVVDRAKVRHQRKVIRHLRHRVERLRHRLHHR